MPAPVIYVVGVTAVIATAATVYVVKQHVWEPHVKPKFDKWVDEMKMRVHTRRQRPGRRGRTSQAAVPILSHHADSPERDDRESDFTDPPVEMTVVDAATAHTTGSNINNNASMRSRTSQRHEFDAPIMSIPTEPLIPSPVRTMTPPRSPFVVSEQFASPPQPSHHSLMDDDHEHISSSGIPSSPSSVSLDETASSYASANASLRSSTADLETLQSRAFSDSLNMPVSVIPGSPTAASDSFSFASISGRSPGSDHRENGGGSDWDALASEDNHWVSVSEPRTSP